MSVRLLVEVEEQLKAAALQGPGTVQERLASARSRLPRIPEPSMPLEAWELPNVLCAPRLSAATYKQIYSEQADRLPRHLVAPAHIEEARAYVESLFNVDLSRVRVEVVDDEDWDGDSAEAIALRGGVDNHLIVIPRHSPCIPTENLVHEFGHAGHYTAQRQSSDYMFYWSNDITAEFAAHFCQYNFILDKLSREDFMRAMLQVVTSMVALTAFGSGIQQFFETKDAIPIVEGCPNRPLIETLDRFKNDSQYFLSECRRAVSQILALVLLDRREEMRRFIRLDRIDRSLKSKLSEAFPDDLVTERVVDLNEQISTLLDRFKTRPHPFSAVST